MKANMKKLVINLLFSLIVIYGTYLILSFLYSRTVLESFRTNDNFIKVNWLEFINIKNEKNEKLIKYINLVDVDKKLEDSLSFYIQNRIYNEKLIYKSTNLKFFIKNEYDINSNTLKLFNSNSVKNEKIKQLEGELNLMNKKMNLIIKNYNEMVLKFNNYRSTFPNYLVANKVNVKNIKFFEIKYGIVNKNPSVKSNIEKWVETGDSKYLE